MLMFAAPTPKHPPPHFPALSPTNQLAIQPLSGAVTSLIEESGKNYEIHGAARSRVEIVHKHMLPSNVGISIHRSFILVVGKRREVPGLLNDYSNNQKYYIMCDVTALIRAGHLTDIWG